MYDLMTHAISVLTKGIKGYIPKDFSKTLPTGTEIKFLLEGSNVKKIISKTNGDKITSVFALKGKNLHEIVQETPRGVIEYSFGQQFFDKIIKVKVNEGTFFKDRTMYEFKGYRTRNGGILYSSITGRYADANAYMSQFKTALDYIRGKASIAQYVMSKS